MHPHRQELAVEALLEHDATQLARLLLKRDDRASLGFASKIAKESGGCPLFVWELPQHVQEDPIITDQTLALDEVIWIRVNRLPEETRQLLELIAVAGRPLVVTAAYQALGIGTKCQNLLIQLRTRNLIRKTESEAASTLVEAYHDRIRESVMSHLEEPAPKALQPDSRRDDSENQRPLGGEHASSSGECDVLILRVSGPFHEFIDVEEDADRCGQSRQFVGCEVGIDGAFARLQGLECCGRLLLKSLAASIESADQRGQFGVVWRARQHAPEGPSDARLGRRAAVLQRAFGENSGRFEVRHVVHQVESLKRRVRAREFDTAEVAARCVEEGEARRGDSSLLKGVETATVEARPVILHIDGHRAGNRFRAEFLPQTGRLVRLDARATERLDQQATRRQRRVANHLGRKSKTRPACKPLVAGVSRKHPFVDPRGLPVRGRSDELAESPLNVEAESRVQS